MHPIDAALEPPIGQTCEICGSAGRGRLAGVVLDHDHTTGRFRGWLCDRCNRAISALDHEDVLRAAIAYLARRPISLSPTVENAVENANGEFPDAPGDA